MTERDALGNRLPPEREPVTSSEFDVVCDLLEVLLAVLPPDMPVVAGFKAMRKLREPMPLARPLGAEEVSP